MIESVLVYFLKYIFYKIFKALETVQIQIINMNYTKTNKPLTFLYPSPSHDMFPATQLRNLILIFFRTLLDNNHFLHCLVMHSLQLVGNAVKVFFHPG